MIQNAVKVKYLFAIKDAKDVEYFLPSKPLYYTEM